jgi:hypothetical protein
VYEAEIQEMWMKLECTFIGLNQAATIKEKIGGDWVLLEKHESGPWFPTHTSGSMETRQSYNNIRQIVQ